MKRFAIWDKVSPIITPIGEVLSADQWKARYPVAQLDSITVICAAGEINGAIFDTLGAMTQRYEAQGVDFSACATNEEKLALIEAYEDEMEAIAQAKAASEASTAERQAAALEAIANGATGESTAVINALLGEDEESEEA